MFDEGRAGENEETTQSMNTSVADKLQHVANVVTKHYDTALVKEAGNQSAIADLVVNGEILATNLPATFLLGLESRLQLLRRVYITLPTLDPSLDWEADATAGENVWRAEVPVSFRTEKVPQHKVVVPATEEHPAQVHGWTEDVKVARIEVTKFSGMITSARKAVLLSRLDTLIGAVKQARQRANLAEVTQLKVGEVLFAFINA
jgi:hypothetical protein